MKKIWRLFIN